MPKTFHFDPKIAMSLVHQRQSGPSGCLETCVAMLAGLSKEQVAPERTPYELVTRYLGKPLALRYCVRRPTTLACVPL